MKQIFVIDWTLTGAFLLSSFSGFALHIAGEGNNHELWHNWAVCHVLTSLLFLIAATLHVKGHWGWYKGLIRKGIDHKKRVTATLTVVFLIATLTGIALLAVSGANSTIGIWHYRIGIVLSVISVGHIIKRLPTLRKSLKTSGNINRKLR